MAEDERCISVRENPEGHEREAEERRGGKGEAIGGDVVRRMVGGGAGRIADEGRHVDLEGVKNVKVEAPAPDAWIELDTHSLEGRTSRVPG